MTVFGKSWDFHVTAVMGTRLDENVAMIRDTVGHLRQNGRDVIYDAEHFFDGFRADPGYALATVAAAAQAGADTVVLCDTNGGTLPFDVPEVMARVRAHLGSGVRLGIHAHNDCGLALANSIAAVQAGAVMVHGTVNGYGERCGNTDLTRGRPGPAAQDGPGLHVARRT